MGRVYRIRQLTPAEVAQHQLERAEERQRRGGRGFTRPEHQELLQDMKDNKVSGDSKVGYVRSRSQKRR